MIMLEYCAGKQNKKQSKKKKRNQNIKQKSPEHNAFFEKKFTKAAMKVNSFHTDCNKKSRW